jgi:regulator of sirC expression with transglutaminase-like and TPR domain
MNFVDLPPEILAKVLFCLHDDERSIGRLSLTNSVLYHRIRSNEELWKEIVHRKWSTKSRLQEWSEQQQQENERNSSHENHHLGDDNELVDNDASSSSSRTSRESTTGSESSRSIFLIRTKMDAVALEAIREMAKDLHKDLGLDETETDEQPSSSSSTTTTMIESSHNLLGRAWNHSNHAFLFQFRLDHYDALKSTACRIHHQILHGTTALSTLERLTGFLAARTLQNLHLANSLFEWTRRSNVEEQPPRRRRVSYPTIVEMQSDTTSEAQNEHENAIGEFSEETLSLDSPSTTLVAAKMLEDFAFGICEMQRTSMDLIHEERFQHSIRQAKATLDEIAGSCRERIESTEHAPNPTVLSKMEIINDVLVKEYGFAGNSEDYYNYKNSLLDCVIQTKKGIPLTLSILYSCVCHRLGIPIQITGLPGHVVLGFDIDDTDESTERRAYMDVFHGGRILSVTDCRSIVSHYPVPWDDSYLLPLRNTSVIQRILNNLSHCHFQAMAKNTPFHADLFFQQRALVSIHRQAPGMAGLLADRVAEALPITLTRDLLREFGLLAAR